MHDADLLAVSLADLDRGGSNLRDYLSSKKDMPVSVVLSLIAADRIRVAPRPVPSDEFRARARGQFVALIQQQANKRSVTLLQTVARRLRGVLLGPAFGPVAAVLLSASGAGAWSASLMASPNTVLYPAKLATERLQLAVAVTSDEKAEIRLSNAAARLVEAEFELEAGNAPLAAALFSQFDREYLEARAIVAAQPELVVGNPLVAQLDRRLSVLRAERNQTGALVAPGTDVAAASTDSSTGGVASADPAKFGGSTPSDVDSKVSTKPSQPGTVGGTNTMVAESTVVASASTSSQTVRPAIAASVDQSVRLSQLLVAQVHARDTDAAFATAGSFASIVHELSTSDNNVTATLQQERGTIAAALPAATPETIGALRLALSSLDDVLGISESSDSRFVAPVATPVLSQDPAPRKSVVPSGGDIPVQRPTPKVPGSPRAGRTVPPGRKLPDLLPSLPGSLLPVMSALSPRVIVGTHDKPNIEHLIRPEKSIVPVTSLGGTPAVRPAIWPRRKSVTTVGHSNGRPIAVVARAPARVTSIGGIAAVKVSKL